MIPAPTDWNGIALGKLTRVLGERPGRELMAEVLRIVGLPELRSATELRLFSKALAARGGFAAAIAGLLSLHATMYEGPP